MIGQVNLGHKGVKSNTTPQIRAAGKVTRKEEEGAKQCVEPEVYGRRPTTPPEIKKFRKSTIHEPGKIVRHHGLADDSIPNADLAFGIKTTTPYGENVGNVIKTYPENELMQWRLDQLEKNYASSKREPLGKTLSRGHTLPEGVGIDKPFGLTVNAVLKDKNPESKTLIYPIGTEDEDPHQAHHLQYVKSHGDYAPGEQRNRGYDWDSVGLNPKETVFGVHDAHPYRNGVAKALNPSRHEDFKSGATIVQKRLEDFKITNDDELGLCKNLGHDTKPKNSTSHTYGVPSRRFEEWGVRSLIKGDYSADEQTPDPDLSKSLRKGFRNETTETRPFGAPTIRTDIVAPRMKSVADNQNYGNEPDAASLLYPANGADRGVTDEDYLRPYSEGEMLDFYSAAGIPLDKTTFDSCYLKAAKIDNLGGKCCIHTFQKVKRSLSSFS